MTSYLEVLIANTSLFDAEIAAVVTRRQLLVAIVDLYKALGGGWTVDGEPEQAGQPVSARSHESASD